MDKAKAAGYPIVTRAEVSARYEVTDDLAFITELSTSVAFVMGPDETKVEFIENPSMTGTMSRHHVHYAAPNAEEMRVWYVKVFDAKAANRGVSVMRRLSTHGIGADVTPEAFRHGQRALDHIGFEIRNLEQFCKDLEAKGIAGSRLRQGVCR